MKLYGTKWYNKSDQEGVSLIDGFMVMWIVILMVFTLVMLSV